MRGGIEDNSEIIFLISLKTYVVTPRLNRFYEIALMMGHKI